MPLFGSKKKEPKDDDIEDGEEEGLFMAQSSEQPPAAATPAGDSAAEGDADEATAESDEALGGAFTVAAEAGDASAVEGDADEAEAESDKAPDGTFTVAAEADAEEESSVDDLLSAFQDDETHGDLADITKELEDVPIADLLVELREIRAMLPAEALEKREEAA